MGIRYPGKAFLKKTKTSQKTSERRFNTRRNLIFNDQNRLVLRPFIRVGLPISRGQVFSLISLDNPLAW